MRREYIQTLKGILKVVMGLAVGIAIGFVFTEALKVLFNLVNLEEKL